MPVTVKRDEQMYGHKNNSESLFEAYFKDKICDSKEKNRAMRIVQLLQRKVL